MEQRKFISKRVIASFLSLTLCMVTFFSCTLTSTIEKKKSYLIGIDPTWYPLKLRGKDKNLEAFIKGVIKDGARFKDVQVEFVSRSWDNLLEGLERGQYDAMITTLIPRDFYANKLFFSSCFFQTGPVLVVRKSFHMPQTMQGKVIAA
ncbi:hypothetical protein COB21_06045, partial [Candidatus Aerophobetes bacterium]